jgi:D-amino peptidase
MSKHPSLKFYISADLEGICGVVSLKQCSPEPDRAAYEAAVTQMMREVRIVAETLLASNRVAEIVVNDAHCSMLNLSYGAMPPGVSLVSGKPKKLAMTAGLDEHFEGLILLGYHAKAGVLKGVLSHTFHHRLFDVSINGVSYGEGGVNTLHAALSYGVPLVLASGDRAFAEEMHSLLPGLPIVETKAGLGQNAAICHPWPQVEADYRQKTEKMLAAFENKASSSQLTIGQAPFEVRVTYLTPLAADNACILPGVKREDGRTISFRAETFAEAYGLLQASYTILAATAENEGL